ncbi:MAG: hypothetical protein SPJ83_02435 [Helicobacter sp.]|uniref:hypothetical protein n=1 Tax=Helicobacter sp. TaxID=218 RepID=UPI002A919CB3|nr:hypothetical protein [Helicobacter sp.]MDY5821646.1 hypothetical protein [Helicobacter sp.]
MKIERSDNELQNRMQSVPKELNCHGYEKGETFKLVLLSFLGDRSILCMKHWSGQKALLQREWH